VQLGKIEGVEKLADSIQNSGPHIVEVLDLDKRVEYSAVAKPPKVEGGRLESPPPDPPKAGVSAS
jgi:hypothetical protein